MKRESEGVVLSGKLAGWNVLPSALSFSRRGKSIRKIMPAPGRRRLDGASRVVLEKPARAGHADRGSRRALEQHHPGLTGSLHVGGPMRGSRQANLRLDQRGSVRAARKRVQLAHPRDGHERADRFRPAELGVLPEVVQQAGLHHHRLHAGRQRRDSVDPRRTLRAAPATVLG